MEHTADHAGSGTPVVVVLAGCDARPWSEVATGVPDVIVVHLPEPDLLRDEPGDVVVLGPGVEDRAAPLQTLARSGRRLEAIVVTRPEEAAPLAARIRAAGFLGGSVRVFPDGDVTAVIEAVAAAVAEVRPPRAAPIPTVAFGSLSSSGQVSPEAALAPVADILAAGVVVLDVVGRVVGLNRAAEHLLGVAWAKVAGEKIGDLLPRSQGPVVETILQTMHSDHVVRRSLVLEEAGRLRHLRVTVARYEAPGGLPGVTLVLEDATDGVLLGEFRHEVERLRAMNRAMGAQASVQAEFVATVSHELRTPLNTLLGMSEFLVNTDLGADQREFVDTIRLSAKVLASLCQNALELVKMDSGQVTPVLEPFAVSTWLTEALRLVGPQAAAKGLQLGSTVEEGVPAVVLGDADRLRQVLMNLLANAVKFTDRGEVHVTVATHRGRRQPELHVTVQDSGPGIPAELLDRLFVPFGQVSASAAKRAQGTGLGLAISRSLLRLLGGQIWAESVVGAGSSFHFRFPLVGAFQGANRTLLVVDDEDVGLGELIRSWGLEAFVVASADAPGRLLVGEGRCDAVVLTHRGREVAVPELARQLRDRPETAGLPLVLLHEQGPQVVDVGPFDEVLALPVDPVALELSLTRLLREGRRQRPTPPDPTMAARLPLRILVVEDDEANQRVAHLMLSSLGYHADVASDGWEAVHAVCAGLHDVVFMDVLLPDIDGYRSSDEIRRRLGPAAPKIVAVTGRDSREDRLRGREAGMDAYLTKPITVEKLLDVLTRVTADRQTSEAG